jgi:hypothetical protein
MPEAEKTKIMRQRRQWAIQGRSGPFLFVTVLPDFLLALILLPVWAVVVVIACVLRPSGIRRLAFFVKYARYPGSSEA